MTFEFYIPHNFHKLSIEQQDEILETFYLKLNTFNLDKAKHDQVIKTIGDEILKMRIETLFEIETNKAMKTKTKKTKKNE
jgi:hypothetical protein